MQLATVQGASIPNAYGGKQPQIQVDLDTDALQAKGLSPSDVVNAVSLQNLILPGGTSKIGGIEYDVRMNSSPDTVAELNDLPIKLVNGVPIYIRDVANVRNGSPPQTNVVRVDGQRAVAAVGDQERRGLDARHHLARQGAAAADRRRAAAGARDRAARRSVAVRPRLDRGRRPRSGHRRAA